MASGIFQVGSACVLRMLMVSALLAWRPDLYCLFRCGFWDSWSLGVLDGRMYCVCPLDHMSAHVDFGTDGNGSQVFRFGLISMNDCLMDMEHRTQAIENQTMIQSGRILE